MTGFQTVTLLSVEHQFEFDVWFFAISKREASSLPLIFGSLYKR